MDRKEKAHVRDISKKIKKKKRKVKQQKIQQTREGTDYSGRGIRSIANIKTRKILITRMRNEFGDIEQRGKVLLTHFRFFCEDLYSRKNDEREDEEDNEDRLENTCDHADDDDEQILKTMNKTNISQNSP